MYSIALRTAAAFITLVFGWAALAKIARQTRWRTALDAYSLDPPLRIAVLILTPLAEASVVAMLVAGQTRAGAALALSLLALFSGSLIKARRVKGDRLPCGCFGGDAERDYRFMLVRNALLALPALLLVRAGSDVELWRGLGFRAVDVLPAGLVAIGAGVAVWTAWQASTALKRRTPS